MQKEQKTIAEAIGVLINSGLIVKIINGTTSIITDNPEQFKSLAEELNLFKSSETETRIYQDDNGKNAQTVTTHYRAYKVKNSEYDKDITVSCSHGDLPF